MQDRSGQRVGAIELIELIGSGGMGEVYRGYDHKLGRTVAVKTIRRDGRVSAELKARFIREARLLSRIGHPSICLVHDLIESLEADFLVLEYIRGRNLRQLVREGITAEQLLEIALQIARALAAAHAQKVVHRDLKPENVMVTDAGQVKVLDFGIARSTDSDGEEERNQTPVAVAAPVLWPHTSPHAETVRSETDTDNGMLATDPALLAYQTHAGAVLGTHRYMSPEQAAGLTVGTPTDLFSFGVLLEELLQARASERRDFVIDGDLLALISSLKQPNPELRPSAEQLADQLQKLRDKPALVRRKRLVQRIAIAAGIASMLLLLITAAALLEARSARALAERRAGQAEDLIQFMMGDLHTKLKPIGKLELLDSVGERALGYFAQVDAEQLRRGEAITLMRTLHQLAELRITNARYDEALSLIARSRALLTVHLAREPKEPIWGFLLCESFSYEGYTEMELEHGTLARAAFAEAVRHCEAAIALAPPDEIGLEISAGAYSAYGALLSTQARFSPAIEALNRALALYQQREERPDRKSMQAEIAAALGWLSSTHESAWQLIPARSARARNVEILQQLRAKAPEDRVMQADLCVALRYRARLELATGAADAALRSLREGLALAEQLNQIDPDNALWRRDLALQHAQLGWTLANAGKPQEAVQSLETALAQLRSFLALDPKNPDRLRLLAQAEQRRAALAIAQAQPDQARTLLDSAEPRWRSLLSTDAELPSNRLGLAQTLGLRAKLSTEPAQSAATAQLAIAQIEAIAPEARSFEVAASQAQLLRIAGDVAAAEVLEKQLTSAGFSAESL